MDFFGYRRPDGKAGIRNHVLILPSSVCSSETCRIVSECVKGVIYVPNTGGCGEVDQNLKITEDMYSGLAANPNVYGAIVIGLGCESNNPYHFCDIIRTKTNKPLECLVIQEEGGTINTIQKAVKLASEMVQQASQQKKEPIHASELLIGIECGGSDATSGLAANPAVGEASNRIIDLGGSTIMSETSEFIGAEHILSKRAATKEIHNQIISMCQKLEEHFALAGQNLRTGQPSIGNKEGGLSTIEEKSLGCIHKGGTRPIVEVVEYANIPTKKGAIVMDTSGFDMASVPAKVAAGCQIIVFTTGRGTPTGNIIAPVLKITGNPDTFKGMKDNIDLDASGILDGKVTIGEMGGRIVEEILLIANGKITKAEAFGFNEMSIQRTCKYV